LEALVRFIARENPAVAERFGVALLEKVKLLRDHPMLGRIVP
jgi:plasmid stabilization system protein ParE